MRFPWFADDGTDGAPDRSPQVTVDDIIARVLAEHRAAQLAAIHSDDRPADSGPTVGAADNPPSVPRPVMAIALGFSHGVPTWALSLQEAHRHLQQHRECQIDECPRKAYAWRLLIEAGKVRPDSTRTR